eukprot:TRINITY_DN17553_c0_g1_i1.p2 TRINITY_DN17553_c0_g1~~TRINITY_DN17553_c0_g1_i1.p2  ORF type:complete len:121 (+),score=9.81 TRINITY_DN17553_c0_g1_i1:28-390(+)
MRSFMPPPQSALHSLHPSQSARLQSIGHFCKLHALVFAKGGHFVPPFIGVMILRERTTVPFAQLLEHSSASHSDTVQSWKKALVSPPCILKSSPRIFFKPHSSPSKFSYLVWQVTVSAAY